MEYDIEVTDTFGGEANYAWVQRKTLTVSDDASDLTIVRRAKALMGWTGTPCKTENYNGEFSLRPQGICHIMFVTPQV